MTHAYRYSYGPFDRFLRFLRFRMALSQIPPHTTVCDLGCGDGAFLAKIAGRIARGIGVDLVTPPRHTANITFAACDLESAALPIESFSCDCVTAFAILEHVNHPPRLLAEVHRILRPGGTLFLTVPSPRAKPLLELLAAFHIINPHFIRDHKRYPTKETLSLMLGAAGFRDIRITPFEFGCNLFVTAVRT